MKRGKVTIKFHYDAFARFRRSFQSELDARGQAIERVAGKHFKYEARPNSQRARGVVYAADPEGAKQQAKDRTLSKALDAGRV